MNNYPHAIIIGGSLGGLLTVCLAFLKVMNLIAPPPSLFYPRILWRVLRSGSQKTAHTPNALKRAQQIR